MDWWTPRQPGHSHASRGDGRPLVTELFDDLLIGEYPREIDIPWLKQEFGVSAVHNLQDQHDLRAYGLDIENLRRLYGHEGIKVVHTPIPDGSAEELAHRLDEA